MALQYDGDGYVIIDAIADAGAFNYTGIVFTWEAADQVILGNTTNIQDGLLTTATGVQLRMNNIARDITIPNLVAGTVITINELSRNASNQVVFTANGVTASGLTNAAIFDINRLGTRTNNIFSNRYTGLMSGVWNIGGQAFDFDNSTGSVLTNNNGTDGTLTDFTSGGFTAPVPVATQSLKFDTQGSVLLPIFTAADDIVFETTQKFYSGRVWIGKTSARQDYIMGSNAVVATPYLRINIAGINKDFEFAKMQDGDFVNVRMVRKAGNSVLNIIVTYDGVSKGDTLSSGAAITFDVLGEYATPSAGIRYNANMVGTMKMSRIGDDRLYDFSNISIADTLIDTVSNQNGALRNFTTGGFLAIKEILLDLDTYRLRRDINGQADFVIKGTIANPAASETLQYSLDGGSFQTLVATTNGTFNTTVTITDIQDLQIRLVSDNTITANATNLKAVFIIYEWGQSNGAGQGENNQVPVVIGDNPLPEMIRVLEDGVLSATGVLSSGTVTIQDVRDPTTAYSVFDTASGNGSTWPYILEQYANRGIPVVLYNIAVGGTGIEQWLRGSTSDPAYYQEPNELPAIIRNMGNPHFITAYRGEYEIARIGAATPIEERYTQQSIEDLYNLATDQHFADYNCPTFWTIPTTIATSNYVVYKAAMDNVIASNTNAYYGGVIQDVVTLQNDGGVTDDGIHLTTDSQLLAGAEARYDAFVLEEENLGFFPALEVVLPGVAVGGISLLQFSMMGVMR